MIRFAKLLPLIVVCVGMIGCSSGSSDMPELAPVSGTVTLDGEPVTNATVSFQSESGQVSYGNTDAQGHYELTYRDDAKGAEPGMNTVRIETGLDAPAPPGYRDPIPAKYNQATELKVEVKPGENTHDFTLES